VKNGYRLITSVNDIGEFLNDLDATEEIAYDIETRGLDFLTDKIRLAQYELNGNIYILHLDASLEAERLFKYITGLIEKSGKTVLSHNSKFEIKFTLANTGIVLHNIYDTQLAEVLLTAGVGTKYPRLENLVAFYCEIELDKDMAMEFVTSDIITQEMLVYAALDVKYLKRIKEFQLGEAEKWKMLHILELEMKLLPVVARMEYDGVKLDLEKWLLLNEAHEKEVVRLKKEITRLLLKTTFDSAFESSNNALEVFQYYKMPVIPKTKTRTKFLEEMTDKAFVFKEVKADWNINSNPQAKRALHLLGYPLEGTAEGLLNPLREDAFIDCVLQYRKHSKLASTYGTNWEGHIHPKTGRIHPEWNQGGAATGRWTSSKPNIQNIVANSAYRSCFIARPGYLLITADYSQAELRLVGAVTGEETIIDAYLNDEDIHSKTASVVFDVPIEELIPKQRERGKTLNFSILYGSTDFGIAVRNKDIDLSEARALVKKFFAGFPKLSKWIKLMGNALWDRKYSKTPFGRIRFFNDRMIFKDEKEMYRYMSRVKREGINHVIQGGSADSLKIGMVDAYYNKQFTHDEFRFLKQVHDEVVVEVKEEVVGEAVSWLVRCLEKSEQQFLGVIPAIVDYDIKPYWSKQ
jgi:DNA polymerase-1